MQKNKRSEKLSMERKERKGRKKGRMDKRGKITTGGTTPLMGLKDKGIN